MVYVTNSFVEFVDDFVGFFLWIVWLEFAKNNTVLFTQLKYIIKISFISFQKTCIST